MNAAVALLDWIGRQAAADRRSRRRAVSEIKAPVMLRALNNVALHQAVGKMRIAVRAESVGRVEPALFIAIDGVSFSPWSKRMASARRKIGGRAHSTQPVGIGLRLGRNGGFARVAFGLGSRRLT